jgi:hypothetical protein
LFFCHRAILDFNVASNDAYQNNVASNEAYQNNNSDDNNNKNIRQKNYKFHYTSRSERKELILVYHKASTWDFSFIY